MLYVNIEKKTKDFHLKVDFNMEEAVMGLLGASGSGKSMTLKCIAGIESPDVGQIILNNRILFDSKKKVNLRPQDRKVGYLFQNYALFPNMTVEENISMGIRGARGKDTLNIVAGKIREMRLNKLEKKKPVQLFGGEQQRVALARILVNKPEILLLDEPFSALDEYLKWKIELEIKEIIENYKIPSIFVSHNRDEVYRICQSVCVLKEGISEEKQRTKDLFAHPKTFASALLSGCKNFSKIEKIGKNKVLAVDWGLEYTVKSVEDQDMVGIRAKCFEIGEKKEENSYPLSIIKEIDELFYTVLMVKTQGKEHIRVEIVKDKWKEIGKRKNLYLTVNPEKVMLLKSGK